MERSRGDGGDLIIIDRVPVIAVSVYFREDNANYDHTIILQMPQMLKCLHTPLTSVRIGSIMNRLSL